jgi:putative transposase
MPRRLRIHVPGAFYHVTLRGNHQCALFVADHDRLLLNKIVARTLEKFEARLHAYCWMTNHLHFLIQAGATALSSPMREIAAEFARAMQSKLETTGHFFERRYHASMVDVDSYLLQLVRYIHLNPVKARLAADAAGFRWSSHHVYMGLRSEPWVTTDFVLAMFGAERGSAQSAYAKFVGGDAAADWSPPVNSRGSQLAVLGDDGFGQRAAADSLTRMPARSGVSLADLIAEACRRFETDAQRLTSPVRDRYVTKVRAWIAHQAHHRGVATLAAVARALGRDESTLRQAMRLHKTEIE